MNNSVANFSLLVIGVISGFKILHVFHRSQFQWLLHYKYMRTRELRRVTVGAVYLWISIHQTIYESLVRNSVHSLYIFGFLKEDQIFSLQYLFTVTLFLSYLVWMILVHYLYFYSMTFELSIILFLLLSSKIPNHILRAFRIIGILFF